MLSGYPLKAPEELLDKDDVSVGELVRSVVERNMRENLPEGLIDMPGPFAVLGYLVSPGKSLLLWAQARAILENALDLIVKELAVYAAQAIENGVKIISFADPAVNWSTWASGFINSLAVNTIRFFQANGAFSEAGAASCMRKTSYSMEKAGFLLARAIQDGCAQALRRYFFEEAQNPKVKFIGHACINKEHQPAPIFIPAGINIDRGNAAMLREILDKSGDGRQISTDEIAYLLGLAAEDQVEQVFEAARKARKKHSATKFFIRLLFISQRFAKTTVRFATSDGITEAAPLPENA